MRVVDSNTFSRSVPKDLKVSFWISLPYDSFLIYLKRFVTRVTTATHQKNDRKQGYYYEI
jgi:hypothetical protein